MVAPSKARWGRAAGGVSGVRRQLKFSAAEPLTVAMTRSPVKGVYCGGYQLECAQTHMKLTHPTAVVLDQGGILPVVGHERAGDGGGDGGGRDVSEAGA